MTSSGLFWGMELNQEWGNEEKNNTVMVQARDDDRQAKEVTAEINCALDSRTQLSSLYSETYTSR